MEENFVSTKNIVGKFASFYLTCISGSMPVLKANTRFAEAPIIVNTLLKPSPGRL